MLKKMMNSWWVLIVLAVFTFTSCDDFYSTSWGKAREYDASKIALSQSNLKTWKKKATGNPELAEALVKKIIKELPGKSGEEKAEFQTTGIDLAIEQSGIGVKILEVAGSALSNIDSEEGVKDLLKKVQSGLDTSQAAANIQALVDGGIETGPDGVPRFKDADVYGETANAANVGMAVMVLALAEINTINDETDLIDLLDHLDIGNGVVTIKGSPTQNEIALAAYLNLISREGYNRFDGNAITGGIKSAFNLSKEI